jgi:hypothetical protein
MSQGIEFELTPDGELIVKHGDARGIIEAMKRAIAKNDPDMTPGAYGEHEDAEDAEDAEDDGDNDEAETDLSPRERARRDRKLIENARASSEFEATKLSKGHTPMIDSDTLISEINKRCGLGLAMVERFVSKGLGDELTEHQVVKLATSDLGGAAAFAKRYQADDALGLILREACTKARNAAWAGAYKNVASSDPSVRAVGDDEARAVGPGSQGVRSNAASRLIEQIVREHRVAHPWKTEEQLRAYGQAMARELERHAEAKGKPGTMERV